MYLLVTSISVADGAKAFIPTGILFTKFHCETLVIIALFKYTCHKTMLPTCVHISQIYLCYFLWMSWTKTNESGLANMPYCFGFALAAVKESLGCSGNRKHVHIFGVSICARGLWF
jgi:hypothetical protein